MMSKKNFQANHCRDFSQNHCNTWYLTSPRTDPRKRWEQAEGTNQSNFSSKPSSAWISQKILVPKHERLMPPLHLQDENKTNCCQSPRKKFSPGKKGYETNSTKPWKTRNLLYDILVNCNLFKGVYCDDVALNAISATIKEMYTHDLKRGDILARQGDIGDKFFLVEYGKLDVLVEQMATCRNHVPVTNKVSEINVGKTVGEMSFMYNTKRSVTLQAAQSTRV